MNNLESYPDNVIKLKELTICSNKLIGGGDLIRIGNYVPLVIGNGKSPKIWLNVEIKNKLFTLIKNNISLNNQVIIIENNQERSTIIKIENKIILSCKLLADYMCVVDQMDLRPIGLNIFGDSENLEIGNSNLSKNTIDSASFLISMSNK